MAYSNILIIAKKSRYALLCERNGKALVNRMVRQGDPLIKNILQSHKDHERLLHSVIAVLEDRGRRYKVAQAFERRPRGRFDLVISIGGDGTFLWASHGVHDVPMLGINSTPRISAGVFCAASASDYRDVLASVLQGRVPSTELTRIETRIDGRALGILALNDVLFCHRIPAATSRYFLRTEDVEEEQRSSGIWISTAAGSSAAMRSAGGRAMPIASRRLQYFVREPHGRELSKLRGFIPPDGVLRIRSKMNQGRVFIDGSHGASDVPFGGTVELMASGCPLRILGIKKSSRKR